MGNRFTHGNQQQGIDSSVSEIGANPSEPSIPYTGIGSMSEDKEYLDGSGAPNELAGPRAGVYESTGVFNKVKELKSDTGDSSVRIEGGEGGERITLSHTTGSGIVIDPDGSIFIIPKGNKGVGISSTTGPIGISGQKLLLDGSGGIEIKGSSLTFRVDEDFTVLTGGTFNVRAQNFNQSISGSYQNYIVGDQTEVVGGNKRETVGGEKRTQISGFYKTDIGDSYTLRAEAESSLNFQDNVYFYTNKKYTLNAGEEVNSLSGTITTIQSKEKMNFNSETTMETTSKEDMTTTSNQKMTISSKSDMGIHTDTKSVMTASDTFEIGSEGDMILTSSENFTAYGSSGSVFSSGGRTELTAENTLQLNYSLTRAPDNPGETGEDKTPINEIASVDSGSASDTNDIVEASEVEVIESSTEIVRELSTYIDAPHIERNYKFGYGFPEREYTDYPVINSVA